MTTKRKFVGVVLLPHKIELTLGNADDPDMVNQAAHRYVQQLGSVDGYNAKLLSMQEVELPPEPPSPLQVA